MHLSRELRGKLIVTDAVRRAWCKWHLVGPDLLALPLPRRAKDWFWRAVVLSPEKPELVPLKSWREQLVNEFSDALRCGTLRSFVASLAKALQAPVINATAESISEGDAWMKQRFGRQRVGSGDEDRRLKVRTLNSLCVLTLLGRVSVALGKPSQRGRKRPTSYYRWRTRQQARCGQPLALARAAPAKVSG